MLQVATDVVHFTLQEITSFFEAALIQADRFELGLQALD